jgi:hypothetical protein
MTKSAAIFDASALPCGSSGAIAFSTRAANELDARL